MRKRGAEGLASPSPPSDDELLDADAIVFDSNADQSADADADTDADANTDAALVPTLAKCEHNSSLYSNE